jgi:hypothetical protein
MIPSLLKLELPPLLPPLPYNIADRPNFGRLTQKGRKKMYTAKKYRRKAN